MSKLNTKEFEEYLITGNEESISSLPSGSLEKEYFYLLKKLNNEDWTPELEKEVDTFVEKIPQNQSHKLKALNIFKKLKNKEKKNKW